MFKLSQAPQSRKISPQEAKTFLALNNFPGQRKLNPIKARAYADQMRDGTMRAVSFAFMTLPDGTKYLANGQHSATAIIIYGKPFYAIVEHYKCDTSEDAYHLFGTFDVHACRTEGHIMKAARGLFKDSNLNDLPLRTLQNCGSALFILGEGENPQFGGTPASKTVKPDLVQRHAEDVLWASFFQDAKHLDKVAVVAAMIATYRANPEAAYDFWLLVKTGDNISGGLRCFRDQLIRGQLHGDVSGSQRNKHWFCLCIAWWNSWMRGEKRNSVKLGAMKEIPKVSRTRVSAA